MPIEQDITNEITQKLAEQNPTIKEMIVKTKVDEELEKRKYTALQAIKKIQTLQTSLDEMKQQTVFDNEGNAQVLGWSEADNKRRNEIKQQLEQYNTALLKALNEAEWETITKLVR